MHRRNCRFSAGLKRVWRHIRDSRNDGHCLLTVEGWLREAKIRAESVKYVWLSCLMRFSGWVLCISMQWLRLKACHVACDEYTSGEFCSLQKMWVTGSVMWAVASGESLKFGVQGASASATNWFSRVNGAQDNGIRLYMEWIKIRKTLTLSEMEVQYHHWKDVWHMIMHQCWCS